MTRKDYILIARSLHSTRPQWVPDGNEKRTTYLDRDSQWFHTVQELATALEDENLRFDRSRFIKACCDGI